MRTIAAPSGSTCEKVYEDDCVRKVEELCDIMYEEYCVQLNQSDCVTRQSSLGKQDQNTRPSMQPHGVATTIQIHAFTKLI